MGGFRKITKRGPKINWREGNLAPHPQQRRKIVSNFFSGITGGGGSGRGLLFQQEFQLNCQLRQALIQQTADYCN